LREGGGTRFSGEDHHLPDSQQPGSSFGSGKDSPVSRMTGEQIIWWILRAPGRRSSLVRKGKMGIGSGEDVLPEKGVVHWQKEAH
jgi:hypothetical protein